MKRLPFVSVKEGTKTQPAKPRPPFDLKITTEYMTNNDCYAYGRKIVPKGIMVHSTASPGVMAAAWFDRWNLSFKKGETDRQVCTHAFLDDKGVWQYLPWNQRGWHAGGAANNSYIGFEICEPSGFHYWGTAMVGYDVKKNEPYFRAIWRNAIELCFMLCMMYNLDPNNIIGHYEGAAMGIASNHADPGQWFPKHGESMDSFRAAVKQRFVGGKTTPMYSFPAETKPEEKPADTGDYTLYTAKDDDTLWGIARDHLGAGRRYKEIMALNGLTSDFIRGGEVLKLPKA